MSEAFSFKRVGLGLLLLLALAAGLVGAVPLLVPAEAIRDAVREEIKAVTGFEPVFSGSSRVGVFPAAVVEFTDVSLGDPREPAMVSSKLSAQLRLIPLLFGQIRIAAVALTSPRVLVAFAPDGQSNWTPLLETVGRKLNPEGGREDRAVSFSEIRVEGGTISVRDDERNVTETVSSVDLSLAWPAISKSFGATGGVVWRNQRVDVSLSLNDLAAVLTGNRSGLKLRLVGTDAKLAFDGHINHRPALRIDGTLAADASSLWDFAGWAGDRPRGGGALKRFALKAKTAITGSSVALSDVNVELDGNSAEGALTFAGQSRLSVQGTLAADLLDLTPYVSTLRLLQASEREWNGLSILPDSLSDFDLDLRLSAARVVLSGAKLGRTALGASLHNGRLAVTIGESQAFGGVLKGNLVLARHQTQSSGDLKAQVQFTDVDLETCLAEVFGIKRLEGKGNVSFSVEGAGGSVRELTRTLSGTAALTGTNGALTGLNVEQLLRRLERRPLSGSGDFRGGRTPFEKLSVALRIAQGMATVEDVVFEGSPVRLAVGGSASIPARDLDLKGTASLAIGTDAFELPFIVQGSWDDPIMLPDPQSLIRRSGAAAPLLDAVRDRRTRDAVRSAIEQLSGDGLPRPAQAPSAR